MKTPVLILLLLMSICAFAQHQADSLGLNDLPVLNRQEVEFFNTKLQRHRGDFNFENKQVAFVTGSSGAMISSKSRFFDCCIRPWTEVGASPQLWLVRLTEEEKALSGGYDALVLAWVKLFTNRRRQKVLQQLGMAAKAVERKNQTDK